MLSIIISSYQPSYYLALEQNIAETIGIPYELIKVDNPGKMGICEAYNQGAEQAQYDYLLFLHEDVLFETQDWGKVLMNNILQISDFELFGIAGSNYIPYAPTPWWGIEEMCYSNIIHKNLDEGHTTRYSFDENFKKVQLIDGVFIFCKKETWQKTKFDESNKGFHAYDVQFSLDHSKNHATYLINNIILEHFSKGNPDKVWLKSLIKYWKHTHQNPIYHSYELRAFKNFADQLRHLDFSKKEKIEYLIQYFSFQRLGIKNSLFAIKKIIDTLRY